MHTVQLPADELEHWSQAGEQAMQTPDSATVPRGHCVKHCTLLKSSSELAHSVQIEALLHAAQLAMLLLHGKQSNVSR